jgi:hypothetical protein
MEGAKPAASLLAGHLPCKVNPGQRRFSRENRANMPIHRPYARKTRNRITYKAGFFLQRARFHGLTARSRKYFRKTREINLGSA